MITRGSGEFEATVTDADGNEIEVLVKYKGYSDPGKLYGPPEDCYPPEGEIEIVVTGAEGKDIPESEHYRLEESAFEHLVNDDRSR